MKVYVVDNGGQWTHREWRVLKYLKVDTKIVPNTVSFAFIKDADALILSGGAPRVAMDAERMGNNGEFLDKAEFPILGICAGMQFMVNHFGGLTGPADSPEFGRVDLQVHKPDGLFLELPETFTVWASHNDEAKIVSEGFIVTASSSSCPVEAIESKVRPLYGLQFHPEVENTEHGTDIFKNFLRIVEEWKR